MKTWMRLLTALVLCTVWIGCGEDEDEELPEVDCSMGDVPTYSEVGAFQKCNLCHSSEVSGAARQEAPTDINFNTFAAAEAHATKAAAEVNEGAMPPADSGLTLTEAEKQTLYKWALCGAME